ncbi:response regulator receiver protein [Mycobacterium sp. IS-1742]|uniref:GAF and ANTAR domain-containing protein n=1 Tax=Mycobacterium sp. IS-1742 TaxID=1772285 RepID=UPI00073FC870|nr:GAF and ANTAR domain-containing protein [Mycobacterium sp. IS-1742]KUI24972.1 response regulator receiver protein [Mycobacterium sp. IS-1742]
MTVRDDRLEEALEEYVRRYARRAKADMTTALSALTRLAVEHAAGVDHAGVTLVTDGDVIRCLACSDAHPLVLDNIQRGCGQGPCLDAATSGHPLAVDDLASESRWPSFTSRAVTSTPVRAMLTVPVFQDGDTHAALILYADHVGSLDARAKAVGETVAARIAEVLTSERSRGLWVSSLHPDVIAEAKALLMRRFSIDVAQSFAMLVKLAKHQHVSIERVARALVSGDG